MIYYEKIGKGFPIVMIPGFPNNRNTWNNIIPVIQERYSLILLDLPGTGKSDFLSDNMSMEDMAIKVNEVFEKENIEKAILVGHSMGGYTAFNFAKLFPQKVAGMSLVHSSANADSEERIINRTKAIALMKRGELEKKVFLKQLAKNLTSVSFKNEHPEFATKIIENGLSISTDALISLYQSIKNRPSRIDVLKNATFPIQWIIGTEDNSAPMSEMLSQSYIAEINDVVVYQNCGHMSMFECPKLLASDLSRYFDFVTT